MFRLVYLIFLTCAFFTIHVPDALAQSLARVRLSDHAKYSRMIVDWGKRVPYTLKKPGNGNAVLEFKQEGRVSGDTQGTVLRSIKDVRSISSAPLSLAFTYPKDSRIREFYIDNRLIIDVFESPSGEVFRAEQQKPPEPQAAEEAPKPKEKPVGQQEAKPVDAEKKPEPKPEVKAPQEDAVAVVKDIEAPAEEKLETPAAAPEKPQVAKEDPQEVQAADAPPVAAKAESESSENEAEKKVEPEPKKVEAQTQTQTEEAIQEPVADVENADAVSDEGSSAEGDSAEPGVPPAGFSLEDSGEDSGANLITFSLNKATSMAAFRLRNRLWMVHNNPDDLVPPKVSGDEHEKLASFESFSGKGGQVFITPPIVGTDMLVKGKGGGVLWDFVISDKYTSTADTRQISTPEIVFHEINGETNASVEFSMKNAGAKTEVIDPVTGWPIKIITAKTAENYVPERLEFVDFTVLPSPVGLAIVPKVDDLEILLTGRDVKVFRSDGLHVTGAQLSTQNEDVIGSLNEENGASPVNEPRIYAFKDWALNDINAINRSRISTFNLLNSLPKLKQIEQIELLAKAYIAQGMGAEALGLLNWMRIITPEIENRTEYKALCGLANALLARPEEAFSYLSDESLNVYPEIKYWKSYILAEVGNWDLAYKTLPRSLAVLKTYPSPIFNRIANVIAEVYLRAGYPQRAKELLDDMQSNKETLFPEQQVALAYLQGEYARQMGDIKKTKEYWEPLFESENDLYRTKAGLALTRMRVDENDIPLKLALNNLEQLRYAWRGDELEAQVHYWLGHTYAEDNQYARALNIMRDAASMSKLPGFSEQVTHEMSAIFTDLFLNKKLEGVTPLDAATIYEQFSELAPNDEKENDVVKILANYLAQADLFSRASSLLKHQFEHRLSGEEAFKTGLRLSAFYVLDNKQDEALAVLEKLDNVYAALPEEAQTKEKQDEMTLLRVQALSKKGEYNEALFLLDRMEPTADVNHLRADIAWQAGFWDDAADAMNKMIAERNIRLSHRLSDSNRDLLLQYGVALNLANDRIGLTDLRELYAPLMEQTSKGDIFEIITRPRRTPGLADRDTLLSVVAETELFGSFLENYKTAGE